MMLQCISKRYGPAKSSQKTPFFARHKEHDYMHKRGIRHDHSGNIINATYYVSQRKSIAHVIQRSFL